MSDQEQRIFVPKTPIDFQKMKLDRLMQNPEKPVLIPEMPKEKKGHIPPEFVRNVMGSSAGAGSGEFHVYRHLRRKEYSRQKVIDERAVKDQLEEEFHKKIEENRCKMEEKTSKKRAKRQKKKEKLKAKRTKIVKVSEQTEKKIIVESEESSSSSEEVD